MTANPNGPLNINAIKPSIIEGNWVAIDAVEEVEVGIKVASNVPRICSVVKL